MVRVEDLLVDVSAELIEDARRFYDVRPAGRGPGTVEELMEVRSARAAAAPVRHSQMEPTIGRRRSLVLELKPPDPRRRPA